MGKTKKRKERKKKKKKRKNQKENKGKISSSPKLRKKEEEEGEAQTELDKQVGKPLRTEVADLSEAHETKRESGRVKALFIALQAPVQTQMV